MKNNIYMELALEKAFNRIGITSPNPPVGAVMVKNNQIIGIGGTQACGGAHAEICAINQAGDNAADSELYITLEPCCFHGKTPPCTDAIISAKIKKVYIPIIDINPEVSGKGVAALRDAGIEVTILEDYKNESLSILKPFFKRIIEKRSYLVHKSAITIDGKTADSFNNSKWLSNNLSRMIVHRLRSLSDAIIVGKNTYIADKPRLNVRLNDFENNGNLKETPKISGDDNYFFKMLLKKQWETGNKKIVKVVIGLPDNIESEKLFEDDDYIIYEDEKKIKKNMQKKHNLVVIEKNENMIDFILKDLSCRGLNLVIFEGGSRIAGELYKNNSIDELILALTPKIMETGLPLINHDKQSSIDKIKLIKNVSVCMLGDDILYHGYVG